VKDEVVFARLGVISGLGQRLVAHANVLIGRVLKRIHDGRAVLVAELVTDAEGKLRVPCRRRHRDVVNPIGIRRRGCYRRVYHCVQILIRLVEREQEHRVLRMKHRTGKIALENAPLLKRLVRRKILLRIQGRIAEEKIELSVISVRSLLGDDLELPAPGPVILRRVRILIDVDLLHRRR
jgi:hypothetical protein